MTCPLMATLPAQFSGVTVVTKANVYFDGKVGSYHFGTDAAERMEIVAGSCRVTLDGQTAVKSYGAGEFFDVPAKSGFTIEVAGGIAEYICSFLK